MTTSEAIGSSENAKGLRKAVEAAQHPIMRALGELALAHGFTQESLAKELRKRFDLGEKTNGANVHDHFTRARPARETIERYASILGVYEEELYVMEHGSLQPDRESFWEDQLFTTLERVFAADFEDGVVNELRTVFRDKPAVRSRGLVAAARAWTRPVTASKEWALVPPPIDLVAETIFPDVDLRAWLRKRATGEAALFEIYAAVRDLYRDNAKTRAFADACAAILRLDGFDTSEMERFMARTLSGSPASITGALTRVVSPGSAT